MVCTAGLAYRDHGLEVRNWRPALIENRESGDIIGLENQVEGHRVLVANPPERVAQEGFARLKQVVVAQENGMGVVWRWRRMA